MISAVVTEAVHQALTDSGVILSEPVMSLQIYCDDEHLGMSTPQCVRTINHNISI